MEDEDRRDVDIGPGEYPDADLIADAFGDPDDEGDAFIGEPDPL